MLNLKDVKYETSTHWVKQEADGGFTVFESDIGSSTSRVTIGTTGEAGLQKAIYWCDKLHNETIRKREINYANFKHR